MNCGGGQATISRGIWVGDDHASWHSTGLRERRHQSSSCSNDYADLREQSPAALVLVCVIRIELQPVELAGFWPVRNNACSCGCQLVWRRRSLPIAKLKLLQALRLARAVVGRRHEVCFSMALKETRPHRGYSERTRNRKRQSGGRSHESQNDSDAGGGDSTELVAQRA